MNERDSHFNKSKFCCICFCEDDLQDLFLSRYIECNLLALVKIYMDVATHDLLKEICINCIKFLLRTHNFLKQCKEASVILRHYIFPHDATDNFNPESTKLLPAFDSKLLIRKCNVAELEGNVKKYVIASCDISNNGTSDDYVEEDYNDHVNIIEDQNVKVARKGRPRKSFGRCDKIESLNDDLQKNILLKYKSNTNNIFCDQLTAQNIVTKTERVNNTDIDFTALIKGTQETETSIKLECDNFTLTTDTGYSDDDDLPLIIHRDRSLAVTARDDVTNDIGDAKIERDDVKADYDHYFGQENDLFDASEDKFFESSNDRDEGNFILPIIKSATNSKRRCNKKSNKCERIICYLCDLTFERKSKWRQHLKEEHPGVRSNEYICCDICGKQLKAMCMKTHITNVHQGKILINKFLCPICGKLYNANQRRRHTLLHDTPKPYQCEHCSFRCSQRGNLRRHQRRHTGEKPYLCTVCGHGASQKGTLLEHMKSHDVLPTPVNCVFCQLEFATSFEYRRHRRVHKNDITADKAQNGTGGAHGQGKGSSSKGSGEPSGGRLEGIGAVVMDSNLVCPLCKKQLMSESGFKCHVRAHKESGRYRCHHCSKSFTSKATLEYHVRIHTGEKPYRCTACPKRFKQPGHLTAHMAIHANRREHRCTYCDQTFNIKFNLVEHLRIHTGDTIDCEFCGKKFRHNSNRRKHIRETHPVEVKAVRCGDKVS